MKSSSAGALLFAIITAFVLSLVASTFVLLSSSQYKIVDSEVDRIKEYYLAQAGMEWAIYNLYTNPAEWIPAGENGDYTYNTLTLDSKSIGIRVYDLPVAFPNPGDPLVPDFALNNTASYGIQVFVFELGPS